METILDEDSEDDKKVSLGGSQPKTSDVTPHRLSNARSVVLFPDEAVVVSALLDLYLYLHSSCITTYHAVVMDFDVEHCDTDIFDVNCSNSFLWPDFQ